MSLVFHLHNNITDRERNQRHTFLLCLTEDELVWSRMSGQHVNEFEILIDSCLGSWRKCSLTMETNDIKKNECLYVTNCRVFCLPPDMINLIESVK